VKVPGSKNKESLTQILKLFKTIFVSGRIFRPVISKCAGRVQ